MTSDRIDLRHALEALAGHWRKRAEAKGLQFLLDMPVGVSFIAAADPSQVELVLTHLIDNAVQHTRQGSVRLAARKGRNANLVIEVADTGPGVPNAVISAVFLPSVSRIDRDRLNGAERLFACRATAEKLGGSLAVVNRANAGAAFRLALPAVASEAASEAVAPGSEARPAPAPQAVRRIPGFEPAPAPARRRKRLRVLIADDNSLTHMVLSGMLEHQGCEVDSARNGKEAAELAADTAYDLILLDMQMPVMNGVEASAEIRQGGSSAATPIVAITATLADKTRREWDQHDITAYLIKPVKERDIARLLNGLREMARLEAS